ncbi:MAG: alkaline phosphatase D family protein [Armatimonadetes bacterium]|nr:alkaline phosphatase D family protein [Armatimonadota bacterium]
MLSLAIALVLTPAEPVAFDWDNSPDRTWIGRDWWANAVQDWRLKDGRVECLEGRPRLPIRTLQLLTAYLAEDEGVIEVSVEIGQVSEDDPNPDSWAGFNIGHGGDAVDHRITALVHHRPAEDGGMLAYVDGAGRVALRDFSQNMEGGSQWSLSGPVVLEAVPEYAAINRSGKGFGEAGVGTVRLTFRAQPDGDDYRVYIEARATSDGRVISQATYSGIPPGQVEGGIGLLSHLGPEGNEATFWFDEFHASGSKLRVDESRGFGPVLATQYTLSEGILKMTAQMPPFGRHDPQTARLELFRNANWRVADVAILDPDAFTFRFRVTGWDASASVPFRIVLGAVEAWAGTIAKEPNDKEEIVVAAFTGHKTFVGPLRWNSSGIWFPDTEVVEGVSMHDPDLLFFSGDQIYEGDLTGARRKPDDEAYLDYLHKWYRFLWAFRGLMRDRPTVCIPDDHDVYHGNIWGAGGRKAVARDGMTAQDSGGYTMPAAFVNAVHRSQTSHLPDPYDSAPILQRISVYYTSIEYAGVSFAVLADRMFKDSPTPTVPDGDFRNGWPHVDGFNPLSADVPGAVLLGERQERFLERWASDWSNGTWMKVVLSQTPFANVATLPANARSGSVIPSLPVYGPGEYPPDDKPASDGDTNGWPQTARNRALKTIRKAFAMHINGDQHLASVVQYGVDDFRDAGFSFCVPATGNTWPRRWMPIRPGGNRPPGAPRYTGDYYDGFGNRMTVWAIANPRDTGLEPANLYNRVPGYGVVRFNRRTRDITMECWPRWVVPPTDDAQQYEGWPIIINQLDNYGRRRYGFLPPIVSATEQNPVVRVVNEATGETLYTLRISGRSIIPWVFEQGTYTVWFGEPGTDSWTPVRGLRPVSP